MVVHSGAFDSTFASGRKMLRSSSGPAATR